MRFLHLHQNYTQFTLLNPKLQPFSKHLGKMDNSVKKLPGVSQGNICANNYLPGEIIPYLISQRLQFSVTGAFKAFCQG